MEAALSRYRSLTEAMRADVDPAVRKQAAWSLGELGSAIFSAPEFEAGAISALVGGPVPNLKVLVELRPML